MPRVGYCVVFHLEDQGHTGKLVVATGENLNRAVEIVEFISGYDKNHEWFPQEVFDLTKMYAENILGTLSSTDISRLKEYSPEAVDALVNGYPVESTVQSFIPGTLRSLVNRKWELVSDIVLPKPVK